jgi:mRNA interferase RelE/StbE
VSDPSWRLAYASAARRDLRRLDPPVCARVIAALERLAANDPNVDVRTLTGSDELRLRVGNWRVRFIRDTTERQLVILRVLPRGRAYDR